MSLCIMYHGNTLLLLYGKAGRALMMRQLADEASALPIIAGGSSHYHGFGVEAPEMYQWFVFDLVSVRSDIKVLMGPARGTLR